MEAKREIVWSCKSWWWWWVQILVMVMGANLGDGDGCKSWWWGESDSVLNRLSVTLLISSRTVADGGISSLGSIRDWECGTAWPDLSWELQWAEVRIWSISPFDRIITTFIYRILTPRNTLAVANTRPCRFFPACCSCFKMACSGDRLCIKAYVSFVRVWFTGFDVCSNIYTYS